MITTRKRAALETVLRIADMRSLSRLKSNMPASTVIWLKRQLATRRMAVMYGCARKCPKAPQSRARAQVMRVKMEVVTRELPQ